MADLINIWFELKYFFSKKLFQAKLQKMSRLSLSRCLSQESDRTSIHTSSSMRSSLPSVESSSNKKTPINLPQIRHPLSIRSQEDEIDIRGSRCSIQHHKDSVCHTDSPESAKHKKNQGALHQTNTQKPKEKRQSETPFSVNSIPEGVEVAFGDSKKIRLPVFGKFKILFRINGKESRMSLWDK